MKAELKKQERLAEVERLKEMKAKEKELREAERKHAAETKKARKNSQECVLGSLHLRRH